MTLPLEGHIYKEPVGFAQLYLSCNSLVEFSLFINSGMSKMTIYIVIVSFKPGEKFTYFAEDEF